MYFRCVVNGLFRCRECLHVVIALVLALGHFAIDYGKTKRLSIPLGETKTKVISMASYEELA